jgi:hypothetical protein
MKTLLKNCGIFVLIVGELFLTIPFFTKSQNNITLLTGGALVIAGFLVHIAINKKIR